MTETGIGVAFERQIQSPGRDVYRWRLWASDGVSVAPFEAGISKTESVALDGGIPVVALQRVLERIAGEFPAESRLSDLLAAAPIQVRHGDFCDRDFEAAAGPLDP